MAKANGITSLKQAAKLLNKHSPDGESLAYINKDEAKLLKSRGGSGIMTLSGVPTYGLDFWNWNWFGTDKEPQGIVQKAGKLLGYGDQEYTNTKGDVVTRPGRSIIGDAVSVWGALKAKKDQEGLNAAEMEQFNKLNQQLAAAETEFDVGSDFGAQLKPEYETDITKSAAYTPIDFSGSATPDLTIDAKAYGGRIGAADGYPGPHLNMPTFSEGVNQEFPSNELGAIDTTVQEDISTTEGSLQKLVQEIMGLYEDIDIKDAIGLARQIIETQPERFAQGGRIRAFNGGIQGLMPQQGMPQQGMPQQGMPQQGIPQQGLDPRMGYAAQGGRIGFQEGTHGLFSQDDLILLKQFKYDPAEVATWKDKGKGLLHVLRNPNYAQGGRIGAQGGGIMPLLDMGGMEKDYRQDGGFVPIGRREKADDVPARLSKNEFVFTADAVKAAGGGDIDEGAQRMYNVMKNLEAGGDISEQSQGQG